MGRQAPARQEAVAEHLVIVYPEPCLLQVLAHLAQGAHSLLLELANGRSWRVKCNGPSAALDRLRHVMRLPLCESGADFVLTVCQEVGHSPGVDGMDHSEVRLPAGSLPNPCPVQFPSEEDQLLSQMVYVADALADDIQMEGGFFLHCAAAVWEKRCVVFIGPGSAGKTTLSRRLPSNWFGLCDDKALVVRAGSGWHVHPWPTWSRFFWDRTDERWDTASHYPLAGIFVLQKSAVDLVEPVSRMDAVTGLMNSNLQVMYRVFYSKKGERQRAMNTQMFNRATDLALSIPMFRLHFSLTGRFWEPVEETLRDL